MLASEIEQNVITGLEVMHMGDAVKRYIELLFECGVDQPNYRAERLKRRLSNSFGKRPSFWHFTIQKDNTDHFLK